MALMLIAAGTEVSAQNRLAFDQNNEAHAAGTISRGQSRKYVFSAEEGEQISVTISSDYAQSLKLTVVNAETGDELEDETAADIGDMTEIGLINTLAESGTYVITITTSDARSDFQLSVKKE